MAGPCVDVTFSAITKGLGPSKRLIRLTPQNPVVPIGRSSKSPNKGLVCAMNNAWFDSQVMSREHAELYLCLENEQVMIRDDKSMHGTIVNGEKLDKSKPRRLESGDHVTFGTVVRRGLETHPACEFEIIYEFDKLLPTKTASNRSSTYKFPEDYEDDLYSEDDLEDSDDQGSSDRISRGSPETPKISTSAGFIEIIDRGTPQTGGSSMDASMKATPDTIGKAGKNEDNAIRIDDDSSDSGSDDDEDAVSIVSDSESDKESVVNGKSNLGWPLESVDEKASTTAPQTLQTKARPRIGEMNRKEIKHFKDAIFPSDESDGGFEPETLIIDSEDDSSLDLDQDYPDEEEEEYDEFDGVFPRSNSGFESDQVTVSPLRKVQEDKVDESASKIPQNIQPHLLSNAKEISTAEAISRTADKALFFQAREENRANLANLERNNLVLPQARQFSCQGPDLYGHDSFNLPPIRDPMLGIWTKTQDEERDAFDMTSAATYHNSKMAARSKPYAPNFSGLRDLKTNSLKRKADQLEEDDDEPIITGPVNLSQAIPTASEPIATKTTIDTIDREEVPSTVEVTTVIESSPAEVPTTDISETTTTISASASVPTAVAAQGGRPTKRLRTFAQTVGIAALGGIIAGAGLFGALVASAPDFV